MRKAEIKTPNPTAPAPAGGLADVLEAVDSAWHVQPEKAHELLVKSLAQTRSGLTETRRALVTTLGSDLDLLEQVTGLDVTAWRSPERRSTLG